MDVNTLRVASSAAIHIKGVDNQPLYAAGDDGKPDFSKPVRIVVHSPGTQPALVVEARRNSRAIERMNDAEGKYVAPSAEEALAETAEDLSDLTIKFENLSSGDKTGRDLFHSVYSDPALGFIAKQVRKSMGNWGAFKPASAGS